MKKILFKMISKGILNEPLEIPIWNSRTIYWRGKSLSMLVGSYFPGHT